MATTYFAVFTSANTPTWARGDIANGRNGWSATGYAASGNDATPPTSTTSNDDPGTTLSGLTAGTAYKLWAIWDDGATSSNGPIASAEFTTHTAAAITVAAAVATASALVGGAAFQAALTAAAGAATASTLTGSASITAAITSAPGVATASTLAGSVSTAAAITAAAGAATATTLTGVAGTGSSATAAAGLATTGTLTGSSEVAATLTAATGTATTGTLTGSADTGATRPTSDITTTGWTATPGPAFYTMLDEVTQDDADYITSPALGTGAPIILGMGSTLVAGNYTLRVGAQYTGTSGQIQLALVNDSNIVQGLSAWQTLTGAWAAHELAVTTTGSATRVRFEVQA